MKIIYILKKGLHLFPPCLTQILCLHDLGMDIEVYHGKNSETVNRILDERNIVHHEFVNDIQSKNRIESAVNLLRIKPEFRRLNKQIPEDALIWIGNCETAVAFGSKELIKRKFIISVLELDREGSLLEKQLRKIINYAKAVVCCEPHRAVIMKGRYNLPKIPYVVANKPYDVFEEAVLKTELKEKLDSYSDKFIVLYQGIISADRPLEKIAQALKVLNNQKVCFFVLGKCDKEYEQKLKSIYENTVCFGYIPAPNHLLITEKCHIGIANYDMSCLNNIFCAPNKIYEYSKYGLPLLASLNIGLTETVGRCKAAECVDFENVSDIVNGLKKIMADYNTYSENAKKFYSDYDVTAAISEVVRELE